MTYKAWTLVTTKWNSIAVDDVNPQDNEYNEPLCFPKSNVPD
jgi:hypothetical protein